MGSQFCPCIVLLVAFWSVCVFVLVKIDCEQKSRFVFVETTYDASQGLGGLPGLRHDLLGAAHDAIRAASLQEVGAHA